MYQALFRNTKTTFCWLSLALMCLTYLASCQWIRCDTPSQPVGPDWILRATKRLTASTLWKEHDGADRLYIERGCVSETMTDYRHRSRAWTVRCSVFDQSKPKGARSLFKYYHDGIENEVREIERIGDATYMWKSPDMCSWIVGFCRGKFFVEISLVEEGGPETRLSDSGRQALIEFARRLATTL